MELLNRKDYEASIASSRQERMKWWNEARYGMFVHWGLYAFLGRNEWVQAIEAIPLDEYRKLADKFQPNLTPAREWARLAKESGMKYMVMTTKHHEGFCLWDTKQTDFNSVKTNCARDLVKEFVDACREFDLKIGFYYSLMDWNHPDGAKSAYDPEAKKRFLDFTKGCVNELLSNYGKIDILWYDVSRPFHHDEGWESIAMNQMARELQPHIIINNRSILDEDFSTPEGSVNPAETGRGWEACMTFNDTSWGFMPSAAVDSHEPRDILKMLATASSNQGNLLLNIGPAPNGSIPEEAIKPLITVGKWLKENAVAVYGQVDRAGWTSSACGTFSAKGNKAYFWCKNWTGPEIGFGGFKTPLESVYYLANGKEIDFKQEDNRIILKNLPKTGLDKHCSVTVIVFEFKAKPQHVAFPNTPALTV